MRHSLDKIAIALSGICLVHCLAFPVLLALPVVGASAFAHEAFHQWFLLLVLPVSVVALGIGYLRHRDALIVVLGAIALAIITSAALAHTDALSETVLTSVGGILLAASHLLNFRSARPRRIDPVRP